MSISAFGSVLGSNQRIDGRRLWDALMEMAQIGGTAKGGVKRLALSDVDRAGRDRFRVLCEAAGLSVRVDRIGNMFARRAGRDPARAPVLFGSHLDSQPTGGKFDGALGVIAGLEVMRTLDDLGLVTEAPLELVNWTDEEGSRFGKSLMGSGVWAGVYDADATEAMADLDGVTVGQALDATGYRGPSRRRRSRQTRISSCISSRGRSWSARARRSASWSAVRPKFGSTWWQPGGTAMPARRRRACGGTRWSVPRG